MPPDDLLRHLTATTGLSTSEAARVVDDVVAYFTDPVEEVVRRRHRDLQTRGVKNVQIFATIAAELEHRPVAPAPLSQRQLRRIVYG